MHDITQRLLKAHQTMEPIPFMRDDYKLDEAEAYAIQKELIEAICEKDGAEVSGYKISMTSKDTQAIANTHEPAYGTILDQYIDETNVEIDLKDMFEPLIEPEIIFILKEDLSMSADVDEILEKSMIAAGIEVPDARYIDWFPNFSLQDLLVDNTATGRVVHAVEKAPHSFEEMAEIEMTLYHNGKKISTGKSSAVLDNPVLSVKWLVDKLAKSGLQLKKGMVISSGTFISPIRVEKGNYRVEYDGLGACEVTFK